MEIKDKSFKKEMANGIEPCTKRSRMKTDIVLICKGPPRDWLSYCSDSPGGRERQAGVQWEVTGILQIAEWCDQSFAGGRRTRVSDDWEGETRRVDIGQCCSCAAQGVLEANLRVRGSNVQLVEQEGDWSKVMGSLRFLGPQDRYDHCSFHVTSNRYFPMLCLSGPHS